jgi:predicted double-glycine peptidase
MMQIHLSRIVVTIAASCLCHFAQAADKNGDEFVNLLSSDTLHQLPIRSWKSLRDDGIVKQRYDYSCGAASMATILNAVYGRNFSEMDLLKAIDKGTGRASFHDMAHSLNELGFRAQGYAASWEQLVKLKIPVIVYLKFRTDDHFSVVRGIDGDTVWLADPSLGHRTFSRAQFLSMWNTRKDDSDPNLTGKFLVILPAQEDAGVTTNFFTRNPQRQSASAVGSLHLLDQLR